MDRMVTQVANFIDGRETPAIAGEWFDKVLPTDETSKFRVARSREGDVDRAVAAAAKAQPAWALVPPVQRGAILHAIADKLAGARVELAQIVAMETGKSPKDASGEVGGAVAL